MGNLQFRGSPCMGSSLSTLINTCINRSVQSTVSIWLCGHCHIYNVILQHCVLALFSRGLDWKKTIVQQLCFNSNSFLWIVILSCVKFKKQLRELPGTQGLRRDRPWLLLHHNTEWIKSEKKTVKIKHAAIFTGEAYSKQSIFTCPVTYLFIRCNRFFSLVEV